MDYRLWGEVKIFEFSHDSTTKIQLETLLESAPPNLETLLRVKSQRHMFLRNLLMERFIDRLSAIFGQSDSVYYIDVAGTPTKERDFDTYQNSVTARVNFTLSTLGGQYTENNVPEIIGLGTDNTTPTSSDRGLYAPAVPTTGTTYKNCYMSREMGTNAATRDNYLLRVASIWDTTDTFASNIQELGLFTNPVFRSNRAWAGAIAPFTIDFTGGVPNQNLAWQILNLYDINDTGVAPPPNQYSMKTYRRDDNGDAASITYTFNRATQTITYNGNVAYNPQTVAPAQNSVFIAFSPDVLHLADAVAGNNDNWTAPPNNADLVNIPRLCARVALPSPITKNATNLLVVVWMIHFERLTGPPT